MIEKQIILQGLSSEDLINQVAQKVIDSIGLAKITKDVDSDKDVFITKKEAAQTLKVSEGTIDNYRRKGAIKAYRYGNNVRFDKSELLAQIKLMNQ